MLEYDFTSRTRQLGSVVFALTFNKKRMNERIVIGRENEVRHRLENGEGEVYYDETRPLGSLLLNFESDINGIWNKNGMILKDSYSKTFDFSRFDMTTPAVEFLQGKYKSGEPSAMFSAICTWENYLNFYNQRNGATLLTNRLFMLYKPFIVYGEYKPWQSEAVDALTVALQNKESGVELWYPVTKRPFETMVVTSSFLPIIFYCANKIEEWGYVFQQCKVCSKYFLAKSRHFELCSNKCRKVQAVNAKREFDTRAKGDRLEQLDETAYNYWYNRCRKLKKGKYVNVTNAEKFKISLDEFRKETIQRKKLVKSGEVKLADFANWITQQQDLADKLMCEFTQKRHGI